MILISVLLLVSAVKSENSPWVQTPRGRFIGGYKLSHDGRRYETYEGIPFALPPVGNLRFQPPVAISQRFGVKNFTKLQKKCTQYDPFIDRIVGHEDCLYLNIYTPPHKSQLPVLVWMHGGMFHHGAGEDYREKFLMDRDLVFVNFNYRVGPLGFLSTGDDVVPGNMGLKDQAAALKWVHDNILYFGGNPKKVTIAGVSAGAASVQYHYLSHQTRGLFWNGMSFSSTALSPYVFSRQPLLVTKNLASTLSCPTKTTQSMVECLMDVPAEEMIETVYFKILSKAFPFWYPYSLFGPVAEKTSKGYFINKEPEEILKSGDVYDVPWFTSCARDEGLFVVSPFVLDKTKMEWVDKNWDRFNPYLFYYNNTLPVNKRAGLSKKIRQYFFGNSAITTQKQSRQALIEATGEAAVKIHLEKAARLHAKATKSPVYVSHYIYKANQSSSYHLSYNTADLGVSHDDDIYLVLENKFIDPTRTASDRAMLQDMLDNWSSIVSVARPNLGVNWSPLNPNSEWFSYMQMAGPSNFTMQGSSNFAHKNFWKSVNFFI